MTVLAMDWLNSSAAMSSLCAASVACLAEDQINLKPSFCISLNRHNEVFAPIS